MSRRLYVARTIETAGGCAGVNGLPPKAASSCGCARLARLLATAAEAMRPAPDRTLEEASGEVRVDERGREDDERPRHHRPERAVVGERELPEREPDHSEVDQVDRVADVGGPPKRR